VDDARALLGNWVEVRRLISQERRDWALGRETLVDRTELVEREVESLRGRIADAQESIGEADTRLADLVRRNDELKGAAASLSGTIAGLETRTRGLLARLPDTIRDRVKPLSQRFPDDPAGTEMPLAERFQNVVGVLNEVNKFQREVTATSEVRALGDGGTAEVTALYLGVGAGFFATETGLAASIGTGTQAGWEWRPADEAGPAIVTAIAIMNDEHVAEFVQLPVSVD
jgi:hypothetical protein